jgi:dipeptidyl aminopeptidase/acylaminoacyl peptidase
VASPIVALAMLAASAAHSAPVCDSDAHAPKTISTRRLIEAGDLIQLRDIGWSGMADAPLSVSPDGRKIAFIVRRANLAHDDYCFSTVVLDLAHGPRLHIVDSGGDVILNPTPWNGGVVDISNGVPQTPVPKWSPDGRWIAYLRRDNGVTQVWSAAASGGPAKRLTNSAIDIIDFAWSDDGEGIIIATRPGLAASEGRIKAEAPAGFHYDDQFFPAEAGHPTVTDATKPLVQHIALTTGTTGQAADRDAARLRGALATDPYPSAATGPNGLHASLEPANPERPFAADRLHVTDGSGRSLPCLGPYCVGRFAGQWWGADNILYFLKRDGWANNHSSIYSWSPRQGTPHRILSTEDLVTGCVPAQRRLICVREGSVHPRRVASIDLATGSEKTLFDPNPEVGGMTLRPAHRLFWKNSFGIETFGDLVLPAPSRGSGKPPLIVVQYESRGFLRGGTGDEVPIQLLAQAGFAVLSFQRPPSYGTFTRAHTAVEISRAGFHDQLDRRSVQSALEIGVKLLIDRGLVDPRRIGLTGLSDGAVTVQYALVNSHLFAAVAMAQCCVEDINQGLHGPAVGAYLRNWGTPPLGERHDSYWDRLSIVRAADRIDTPILVQISDNEYVSSLVPWAMLRANDKPIDMFVFPNEHHIKLEPAHRLAAYERYLAWFSFWLQDRASPFTTASDLERWRAWKAKQEATDRRPFAGQPNIAPSPRLP